MSESITFDFYEDSFGTRYVARMYGHEAELRVTRRSAQVWSLDHASVPTAMGGRWVAEALIAHAVREAELSQRKLLPLCSFVRALFQRRPEWQAVLATPDGNRVERPNDPGIGYKAGGNPRTADPMAVLPLESAIIAQLRMNEARILRTE
ncbi:MAG: GNAT family N-acetyltransferase [Beijerinckiaceae bacterium]